MPVAIDTSVLIHAEKTAQELAALIPEDEPGPYYVPAHAAAEFLLGTLPPVRKTLRERARSLYDSQFKSLVDVFGEPEAGALAHLNRELRRRGEQMKFYDAAIAATALARGDAVLCRDSDYDRVEGLRVLGPPA